MDPEIKILISYNFDFFFFFFGGGGGALSKGARTLLSETQYHVKEESTYIHFYIISQSLFSPADQDLHCLCSAHKYRLIPVMAVWSKSGMFIL